MSRPSNLPVFDEIDRQILKHKQVHFSSSFPAMIEYYKEEKKGAILPTTVERLYQLHQIEETTGHDLATLVLSDQDIAEIKEAMKAYHRLESLAKQEKNLGDLIFTEEENPKKLIKNLSLEKKAFPLLLEMIQSDDFFNPLFPGYGLAPVLAAKTLSLAKEKKAIPFLFERIGHLDFEVESHFLSALSEFGEDALQFLFQILKHKGSDVQVKHAILALSHFEPSPLIAKRALEKLQQLELDHPDLSFILLIEFCRELKTKQERTQFSKLKEKAHAEIIKEIAQIEKDF